MANELLRTINHTDYLGLWVMDVYEDGTVQVKRCREVREYNLPQVTKVIHGASDDLKATMDEDHIEYMKNYVFMHTVDGMIYQFKFEEENFLVGDIIDENDEVVDEFAMHVFGEDED
jgi:hypothetical protein